MLRPMMAIVASVFVAGVAAADPTPMPRDGERLEFDVFRDGDTRFGIHEIEFRRDGDDILAEVSIRLRAGLGPITVFRYEHDSTERWRDGSLLGLSARTFKDGEIFEVEARYTGGAIGVDGLDPELNPVTLELDPGILTSSHWHGYPEEMAQMLNTEHGTTMETEVTYMGQREIEGDGGRIVVDHYRLVSSLVLDLYYDETGRWAGCEFEARGQRVRYVRRANPAAI